MILSTSAWLQNIIMEKKKNHFFFFFIFVYRQSDMKHVKKQGWVVPTLELIECNLLYEVGHIFITKLSKQ